MMADAPHTPTAATPTARGAATASAASAASATTSTSTSTSTSASTSTSRHVEDLEERYEECLTSGFYVVCTMCDSKPAVSVAHVRPRCSVCLSGAIDVPDNARKPRSWNELMPDTLDNALKVHCDCCAARGRRDPSPIEYFATCSNYIAQTIKEQYPDRYQPRRDLCKLEGKAFSQYLFENTRGRQCVICEDVNPRMICPANRDNQRHELTEITEHSLLTTVLSSQAGYKCAQCQDLFRRVSMASMVAHCSKCGYGYDFCPSCTANQNPARCTSGHTLTNVRFSDLHQHSNSTYRLGYKCKQCTKFFMLVRENVFIKPVEPVAICKTCTSGAYPICTSCFRTTKKCPSNHPLQQIHMGELSETNKAFKNGFMCEACHCEFTLKGAASYCPKCPLGTYFLCPVCTTTRKAMLFFPKPCTHYACIDCFCEWWNVKLSERKFPWDTTRLQYGVTCPSCSVFVDPHLLRLLGEDKYRLFNELCSSKALTSPTLSGIYCAVPGCSEVPFMTASLSDHFGQCPKCKKFTCVACLKLANMCTCANVDPALVARYKKEVQGHLPMCRSQQIPVRERMRTVSLRGQQTYTINYHLDDTIDVLRCLFERDHPDIPCYMQKLVFSGQEMPSNKPLRAFGLSASTTMHLILLSTAQQMPPRDPNSRPTPATGGDASLIGKPCPQCRTVGVHYREHHCHHIKCLQCSYNYCYVCLGAYEGFPAKCKNGCKLWCSRQCDCPVCPDCTDSFKCEYA
ncbi:hypothetical protein Pelo_2487 [Pelomyxa schiedti]|nr:hypothetical protein Pelo_2487 [Pelomyxa schiedti]